MARCYPAPSDWPSLRTPLTGGEETLARALIERLSDDWALYLQPHLAGMRPDLVLVHPRAGVVVVEVKDWDLRRFDLSGDAWRFRDDAGLLHAKEDPFAQADRARDALFRTLLPFAGELREAERGIYGFTRAAAFLTHASAADLGRVRDHLARKSSGAHYGLGSAATLGTDEGLAALIPLLGLEHGNRHVAAIEAEARRIGLARPWHKVLQGWLQPTPDEVQQDRPLELTGAQARAVASPAHRLLVSGPAGSGKTLVLAQRAAQALVRGRDVLLLSFNITLWHYLRAHVARAVRAALLEGRHYTAAERRAHGTARSARYSRELRAAFPRAMRGLTITHLHGYLRDRWAEACPGEPFPASTARIVEAIRQAPVPGGPRYDALFIDEGQDWAEGWLAALVPDLRPGATVTLAAEAEQRLYDHAVADPAALFGGTLTHARLEGTARLPAELLPAVNAFRAAHAPEGTPPPPQLRSAKQLALDFEGRPEPGAVWTDVDAGADRHAAAAARVRAHVEAGVNPSQLACLVATHEEGLALEEALEAMGLNVCSVCVEDPEDDRSRKHAFWHLDARLKLSTVHSFKGWEADVVVLVLPAERRTASEAALYVALTRSRAVLEVVAEAGGPYACPHEGWQRQALEEAREDDTRG